MLLRQQGSFWCPPPIPVSCSAGTISLCSFFLFGWVTAYILAGKDRNQCSTGPHHFNGQKVVDASDGEPNVLRIILTCLLAQGLCYKPPQIQGGLKDHSVESSCIKQRKRNWVEFPPLLTDTLVWRFRIGHDIFRFFSPLSFTNSIVILLSSVWWVSLSCVDIGHPASLTA